MTIESVFDISIDHGEGPLWDVQTNSLYWVDLFAGEFYKGDPATGEFIKKSIGQPLGVMALREAGGMVLAAHDGFGFTDMEPKSPVILFNNPQPDFPETRFNDGKVDPLGNFVAGTMTFTGEQPIGHLYRLQPDKTVDCLESKLMLSNGIDWSPDSNTCYLVDTNRHVVYAYDYNLRNVAISNRRNFIDFSKDEFPDGLCIDTAGNCWIAMWGSSQLIQFDATGKKSKVIELPVTHPTSCCFGGPQLSTLFITTSKHVLTADEIRQQPLAGKILKIETAFQGQVMRRFKG